MVGAHLSRNCKVSKLTLRAIASGFSATASTTGFNAPLITAVVRDSGSFSQSSSSDGASGVDMVDGSLRYCFSASFMSNSIHAEVATGPHRGKLFLIPRITIYTTVEQVGVEFKRCQFPIRPAFAMTINKSQGQTLDSVGLYLPAPVFSHGQLYVALSRVKRPEDIKILITAPSSTLPNLEGKYTSNIVYAEIFRN